MKFDSGKPQSKTLKTLSHLEVYNNSQIAQFIYIVCQALNHNKIKKNVLNNLTKFSVMSTILHVLEIIIP